MRGLGRKTFFIFIVWNLLIALAGGSGDKGPFSDTRSLCLEPLENRSPLKNYSIISLGERLSLEELANMRGKGTGLFGGDSEDKAGFFSKIILWDEVGHPRNRGVTFTNEVGPGAGSQTNRVQTGGP